MMVQNRKNESLNKLRVTIVVLTRDSYLFYGLKALIMALSPQPFKRTHIIYEVINEHNPSATLNKGALSGEKYILITDHDIRFYMEGCQDIMRKVASFFSGIIFMTENVVESGGGEFLISKQSALKSVQKELSAAIHLIIFGHGRLPEKTLAYLSDKELKLLRLIISGLELQHIASVLNTNVKNIYTHRANLFKKAGVRSLQQLYTRIQL